MARPKLVKNEEPAKYDVENIGGSMVKHALLKISLVKQAQDESPDGVFSVYGVDKLVNNWMSEGFRILETHVVANTSQGISVAPNVIQVFYILVKD